MSKYDYEKAGKSISSWDVNKSDFLNKPKCENDSKKDSYDTDRAAKDVLK
ncbi:hypothetical protein [Desulfitibacter alkalitolerans]|nr:hypothetical protein [Desulfitibacter alkalitolerans]